MAYTTIDKPTDFFESKIWTGNGSSQNISLDFAPNFVWIKQRSATRYHNLQDTVRGVGLQLFSNTTSADNSDTANITAFNSDGYSLGSGDNVNKNSSTYVGWSWKAGTSFTNDASSTSIGSIDSAGSVNTDAGFSIISYTGTGSNGTVAHGLGVAPSMIIIKNRESTENWLVYHQDLGNTNALKLNLDTATEATVYYWNNTSPTSSTFSLGSGSEANTDAEGNIAYCFAEKKGYSKFGSYTGNGNADGPFIYTGFKPAFVLIKAFSRTHNWPMLDNKRSTTNVVTKRIDANLDIVEATDNFVDFCSNGIKIRNSYASFNGSGETYIYMAFAEQPFVTSTGVPATAR